jgi:hypothetical protein
MARQLTQILRTKGGLVACTFALFDLVCGPRQLLCGNGANLCIGGNRQLISTTALAY